MHTHAALHPVVLFMMSSFVRWRGPCEQLPVKDFATRTAAILDSAMVFVRLASSDPKTVNLQLEAGRESFLCCRLLSVTADLPAAFKCCCSLSCLLCRPRDLFAHQGRRRVCSGPGCRARTHGQHKE